MAHFKNGLLKYMKQCKQGLKNSHNLFIFMSSQTCMTCFLLHNIKQFDTLTSKKNEEEVQDISQILFIYVIMNWGWLIDKIYIFGQTITLILLKQYDTLGYINKSYFRDLILSSLRLLLHISTSYSTRIVKLSLMRSKMIPCSKVVCIKFSNGCRLTLSCITLMKSLKGTCSPDVPWPCTE